MDDLSKLNKTELIEQAEKFQEELQEALDSKEKLEKELAEMDEARAAVDKELSDVVEAKAAVDKQYDEVKKVQAELEAMIEQMDNEAVGDRRLGLKCTHCDNYFSLSYGAPATFVCQKCGCAVLIPS